MGVLSVLLGSVQACLGVGAKDGERNVVEVTTDNDEGTKVSHTILSMRLGGIEQVSKFIL